MVWSDQLADIKKELDIGQPKIVEKKEEPKKLTTNEAQKLEKLKLEMGIIKPKVVEKKKEPKKLSTNEAQKLEKLKIEMGIIKPKVVEKKAEVQKPKKVVKKLNSDELDKLAKIRADMGIKEPTADEKKLAKIRGELDIEYKLPTKQNSFNDAINSITDEIDIDKIKDKINIDDISDISVDSIKDTLEIGDGEHWGMPSILGFNEKEIPDTVLGSTVLANLKDTGTDIYKGFRYSGSSAETLTGMMYYNSKAYNNMFTIFDDSSINPFGEEEDSSMFDIFD